MARTGLLAGCDGRQDGGHRGGAPAASAEGSIVAAERAYVDFDWISWLVVEMSAFTHRSLTLLIPCCLVPGGKKGAGILRSRPNVKWGADRGKEPLRDQAGFPWFWPDGVCKGPRVNDRHFTCAEKRAARDEARR